MTLRLGDATLTMVNGGDFRLDGGAMHGVVPKTLWSKLVACDDKNRCTYATNCLLVDIGGKRVLVETGNGAKFAARERDIYGIDHDRAVDVALRELGVEPASIDVVIMTHLHFDHAGGATRRRGDAVEPVFPRARHVVQARELDAALHPHERNRASYLAENLEPLRAAGLLETVDGEAEIVPGVRVMPTPGHTPGHQSVLIDGSLGGGDRKAVFLGDVVPTSVHVPLPWVMAYDLDVEATLASKRRLYERAAGERWLLLFGHDRHHAAELELDGRGGFRAGEPFDI
jgi:glyoxylase-like metal-dependent hydrolase (beta-lactamase superfamily II)